MKVWSWNQPGVIWGFITFSWLIWSISWIHMFRCWFYFHWATTCLHSSSKCLMLSSRVFFFYFSSWIPFSSKNFSFFRPNRINALSHVYFWFYIVFLLFRTMTVLFASAGLNEACKKPLHYIRNVPSRHWSLDVSIYDFFVLLCTDFFFSCHQQLKRLYDTIDLEAPTLAFSGQRFFHITKGLILTVIFVLCHRF